MILFLFIFQVLSYGADEVWVEIKGDTRIINARGNCVVRGENFEIYADSAVLYERNDIDSAYLFKNIRVISKKLSIYSDIVFYNFIERTSIFKKNVIIETDTFLIETERVFYSELKDSAYTPEMVFIRDKINNIEIKGSGMNYLVRSKKGSIDSLIYVKIYKKKDTIDVKGRRLIFLSKDLKIIDSVYISSKDFKGKSDTLLWKEEKVFLLGELPSIFTKDSELKGRKIEIQMEDNKIQSIVSEGDSFLKTVSEKKDTLHLFSGILSIFFDDSLRPSRVFGKGGIKGEVRK